MNEVKEILNERAKTHGDFKEVATWYNDLKIVMGKRTNGGAYYDYQQLALDMICQKLARIKCGNPNFKDHWLDIAGYAMLVANELERRENGDK